MEKAEKDYPWKAAFFYTERAKGCTVESHRLDQWVLDWTTAMAFGNKIVTTILG